ncbi:MAG: nuclear transport factor 2 family protein [Terrimicrobiaceae bacterium]
MTALPNEESSEQTEIRALIDDLAEGIRAKDVNGVMSFYADEKVQFLLAPPLKYSGANAIKGEDLKDWFSSFQGPIGYEIRDLEVSTGSQIAFGHSLNRMSGTKIDGAKTDLWFRWTVCFRKIGGKWKITHEHESVPFYMDGSDKAALDLEPSSRPRSCSKI